MKKLAVIIVAALLAALSDFLWEADNKPSFDMISNNVTIWEDSLGKRYIVLALEVSNASNKPLHFKASDFDIVDEDASRVDVMKQVNAYPPIIEPGKVAVYYDAIASDKIADAHIKLKAVPHIEFEKTQIKQDGLFVTGMETGGSSCATAFIKNASRMEYSNVHAAIVSRKENNEVVSVMTATIDSVKPGEEMEVRVEDRLKQRHVGPNMVTRYQSFLYLEP